ncbi:copper amine oxidase [Chitinophaga lutea]|uniref:copper amine oxidase n=1 Tax=Chitinophaga lutea TaxID=2488634 RepID=UPI0015F2D280|nr:copper amine oxidase [Chitinophaga lutea]
MKQPNWKPFLMTCALAGVCSMHAGAQALKPELESAILKTHQGGIVSLPDFLTEKLPDLGYRKIILPGPQHVISDDPEYIRVPEAIALQEPVQPGAVRLYVYNVNGVKEPAKIDRRITAVIRNTGKADMHIRMLKYSSQPPSTNYYQIGKQGLADYFASEPQNIIRTVKPGQVIAIDEKLEKHVVKYDELVHGFYEFTIDQPGEISVLQTDLQTSGPKALARIKTILPPKGHSGAGRGVFGVSNYRVVTDSVHDTRDGVKEIILADGKLDPWVEGKEKNTPGVAHLAGNYGVMYNIEMKWKSSDGKGLALVTWNSRSDNNQWCGGMANTMVVSGGKFKEGIIQLPSDRLITKKAPEAILIQVFKPAPNGEEQTIKLTYSPPGASCLPTPLIFIPVDIR